MLPNHKRRQTWLDKILGERSIKWNVQPTKIYLCSNWWVMFLSYLLLPTILAWEMNFLSICLKDSSPQLPKETNSFLQKSFNSSRAEKPAFYWSSPSSFTTFNHSVLLIETTVSTNIIGKCSKTNAVFSTSPMLFSLLLQSSHPSLWCIVETRTFFTKFQRAKCVLDN